MTIPETVQIVDYSHQSTPEHLEMLGVDPTRLPAADARRYEHELNLPVKERSSLQLVWLLDDRPIGFSTADKIIYGERANMHLHVTDSGRRNKGFGAECVRRSVEIYFELLRLRKLFCEPNRSVHIHSHCSENPMATFIMLTRLGHQALTSPSSLENLSRDVMEHIRTECPGVEWKQSFVVLGPADYLDIFEAPEWDRFTELARYLPPAPRPA